MKNKLIKNFILSALFLALISCAAKPVDKGITIVYTNDVHSFILNEVKDKETKEVHPGLRLSNVSQYVKDLRAEGENVLLVDAGDEIQGNCYGFFDKGESIIELMNAAGYQAATPGNHEFDYGLNRFMELKADADYPYLSCNFRPVADEVKDNVLDAVKIFKCGSKKIAIIGITTPHTFESSTPTYFQDADRNFIYTIDGIEYAEDLYESVQKAIDSVKENVDYIIALGHLGIEGAPGVRSIEVIQNTIGLTAFIDGHSHTVMESGYYTDFGGNTVLLTQTGSYLNNFGVMKIDEEGNVSTKLLKEYEGTDEKVKAVENKIADKINELFGLKIAELENPLYINEPGNPTHRLIRSMETNAGDFVADSVYWYLNEERQIDCDVVIQNGGGIRVTIDSGDVLVQNVKNISPFGNQLCLIEATGQQILDTLEIGTFGIITMEEMENKVPEKGYGFFHVAGVCYDVDTEIKSPLSVDNVGNLVKSDGPYRVRNLEIYNRKTDSYEPIDLEKTYRFGGIDYLLRNGGDGLTLLCDCKVIANNLGQDSDVLSEYFKNFKKEGEYPLVNTENSPLAVYENYLLDYENPFGAGRINTEE